MAFMRALDSPRDEGAGAFVHGHVEREVRAEDVLAEQAALPRLLQGQARILDGERVLLPDVDVALVGADGVGADDQPLEDAVRVSLEQAPVHVGARVALVGVDDDVLGSPGALRVVVST